MRSNERVRIAICGAGIAGIATAHWLAVRHGYADILLIDAQAPMSLTSAASGENYRNWWPQPRLAQFANRGIFLIEELAEGGSFRISRRGYAYATRETDTDSLVARLHKTYGGVGAGEIRVHEGNGPLPEAADGADVLLDRDLIRARFPHLSEDTAAITLVRRAGDVDSQQLGQVMLGEARDKGARLLRMEVKSVAHKAGRFEIEGSAGGETVRVEADTFINAAGPFAKSIAAPLGAELPLECIF